MERWDSRLIGLIRDGLTGLSNVDLVCELLGQLPYRDLAIVSRLNKRVSERFRTELRLRRLMVAKEVDRFVERYNTDSLTWACRSESLDRVNELLDRGYDPSCTNNYPIKYASYRGWLAVVERLLADPRVDPGTSSNYAICWASMNGHLEVVKRLLVESRVDPSDDDNWAIRQAFLNGHIAIVDLLILDPRVASTYTGL